MIAPLHCPRTRCCACCFTSPKYLSRTQDGRSLLGRRACRVGCSIHFPTTGPLHEHASRGDSDTPPKDRHPFRGRGHTHFSLGEESTAASTHGLLDSPCRRHVLSPKPRAAVVDERRGQRARVVMRRTACRPQVSRELWPRSERNDVAVLWVRQVGRTLQ